MSRGVNAAVETGIGPGTDIDRLSADTVAALSINGLGRQLQGAWPEITQQAGVAAIEDLERALGLGLPDDLAFLLGDHSTLAFGGMGTLGVPELALVTDGERSTADTVVERTGGFLTVSDSDGALVLATSPTYARSVMAGGLGGESAFRAAVPNPQSADAVGYLDVPGLLGVAGSSLPAEGRANLDPLQAVGLVATQRGSEGTFTVRLTTR